jgi:hypothetical protein
MSKSRLIAAALAATFGMGVLGASTAPAAADSAYFGFQVGGHHRGGPTVQFGFQTAPAYPVYSYPAYRPVYRPARPVEICEDVWRTRRVHDRWGRLVKVVKVRDRECRLTYR